MSDAAKAASAVFYANTNARYPVSFPNLTTSHPPTLDTPPGVTVSATKLTGAGWTLTMAGGGGATAPTFACDFG